MREIWANRTSRTGAAFRRDLLASTALGLVLESAVTSLWFGTRRHIVEFQSAFMPAHSKIPGLLQLSSANFAEWSEFTSENNDFKEPGKRKSNGETVPPLLTLANHPPHGKCHCHPAQMARLLTYIAPGGGLSNGIFEVQDGFGWKAITRCTGREFVTTRRS